MTTQFRLLGDIEVRIDDRIVDVGHARQQCVLVALLVEANRTVPADQLLERVWASRLPQRAHNTLYGYLSRLRQALSGAGDVAIVRQPSGYRLAVDPMTVDLHRFHHLTAQARAAGDGDAAVALFEQALGLWRGEAFAALDTPWVDQVRTALDADRLAAELDRNDLALDRGRHAALLAGLSARAATYPLDERLAGQFMLALYRCGRQADALRHYQQIRSTLADELGTDPSPPLRLLHKQILAADPALAAAVATAPAAAARAAVPVPRQLPAPPRSFAGRTRELTALDEAVDAADDAPAAVVISAVSGTAGVGKTALAVYWAHQVADRFPDGQLYVNLRGFDPGEAVLSPAEAVRGFLDALGVPSQRLPVGLDGQAGQYRSLLAGRRMLVVLDNARDADQVRPLLPGTPGSAVVVTSRNQLTGLITTEGAHPLTLDLLPPAEAHDLLVGRLGPERVAAEPAAVEDIIARCAGLPLALAIVAARAVTRPGFALGTVAGELRDARSALDALTDADPATDLRAVYSWSYDALSAAAATLFRLLGLHPGPDIATPAAASLAGIPVSRIRAPLAELTHAHLLTEYAPGRYACHDLLRAYAGELAQEVDTGSDREAALHRVFDHYVHTAKAAAMLLDPHREELPLGPARSGVVPERLADHDAAMAWFTAERPVLLAAIERAFASGYDRHVWQLAWSLGDFFERRGHWPDWESALDTALGAARRLADRPGQAYAHRMLARAQAPLGRYGDAHDNLRHALDIFDHLDDRAGQARTHRNLALVLERQGHHREALGHAEHALDLLRGISRGAGLANALNNVGWYHSLLGDHRQALAYCEESLALREAIADRYGQAAAWDSLGYAHHHLGDNLRAITCHHNALRLIRDVGNRYAEATVLTHLGDTHEAAGRPAEARRTWQQALAILEELNHPDADRVRAKLAAGRTP